MPKNEAKKLYQEIQKILFRLIPEKWESLYLYASVINGRGEMFFYYFPKKIFKAKPVSCYEVANKFGINENQYNMILSQLYEKIKLLNNLSARKWTNITISIVNCLFSVEYNYNDLIHSKYTDEQRHIYWEYKYLHTPIESMSKQNQNLVRYYEEENIKPTIYTEGIYIEKNESKTIESSKMGASEIQKIAMQEKLYMQRNQVQATSNLENGVEEPKVRNQILKC